MSVAQTSSVKSLFAPCSAVKFLDDYWPDKPFSVYGSPGRFAAFPFTRIKTLPEVVVRAGYLKLLRHVSLRRKGRYS